jgi:DNA ligase-1
MSAEFLEFALTNDAVAATASKLKKCDLLAAYLRELDDDDLRRTVRFAAGRTFPSTDERVLSVGGRIVSDVVLSLLKIDPGQFYALSVKSGEIGEALSKIWPTWEIDPPLTLEDLSRVFDQLAATGRQERKRELLAELFSRCGHPREATYLAKIIFGDLRTGVQEGVLQSGVATAFGKKLADVQRCQLLVGDLDEVAVLARHDTMGEARFRLFHPIQFMLANPQEDSADAAKTLDGRTFCAEDKLDGIRAQVHKSADRVAIYTRTMDRTDESFPEIVAAMRAIPGEFLIDGEIVPWRDGQVLPFAHIQKRLGRKTISAKTKRENPVAFIAFDLLYRDGQLLMDEPLSARRAALLAIPGLLTLEQTSVTTAQQIDAVFTAARDRRNEGIVLKDPQSPYSPGRRGKMWLKLKTHLPTFDCVVTYAEYGHGKRRDSLSDYTFAVWDKPPAEDGAQLLNVGKAYSGVTDAEIAQLTELFKSIAVAQFGRVYAVKPQVVLEIACDQIQKSDRHDSGYAFRFPRIKRIRWDKRPEDADLLSRVAEVYESHANFGRQTAIAEEPAEPGLFD